jgi:hypothetical protein
MQRFFAMQTLLNDTKLFEAFPRQAFGKKEKPTTLIG